MLLANSWHNASCSHKMTIPFYIKRLLLKKKKKKKVIMNCFCHSPLELML